MIPELPIVLQFPRAHVDLTALHVQVLQVLKAVFDAMSVPSESEDLVFLTRLLQVHAPLCQHHTIC